LGQILDILELLSSRLTRIVILVYLEEKNTLHKRRICRINAANYERFLLPKKAVGFFSFGFFIFKFTGLEGEISILPVRGKPLFLHLCNRSTCIRYLLYGMLIYPNFSFATVLLNWSTLMWQDNCDSWYNYVGIL